MHADDPRTDAAVRHARQVNPVRINAIARANGLNGVKHQFFTESSPPRPHPDRGTGQQKGLPQPRHPSLQIGVARKPGAVQADHQRQRRRGIIRRRHEQAIRKRSSANPNRLRRKHAHRRRIIGATLFEQAAHALRRGIRVRQNRLQDRLSPSAILNREIVRDKGCQGLAGRPERTGCRTGLRGPFPRTGTRLRIPDGRQSDDKQRGHQSTAHEIPIIHHHACPRRGSSGGPLTDVPSRPVKKRSRISLIYIRRRPGFAQSLPAFAA